MTPEAATLTLAAFLLARLDEDEAAARAAAQAATDPGWHVERQGCCGGHFEVLGAETWSMVADITEEATAAHIARHDPARVLAEVAAKRRIVGLMGYVLESWEANHGREGRSLWPDVNRRERSHAHTVLENMALPYADHPDYDERWRP